MSQKFIFVDKNEIPYPAWEMTTLKPFLTESRIKGSNGKEAQKLTVKLYGKGIIAKRESVSGSENTQYFIRKAGQLIYGKLDFLNGAFGLIPSTLDGFESTLDSPSFDISGIDPKFLLELISRKEFYLKNGRKANGSRIAKRIHPDDFLAMPISLPSLPEQQKISEFFSALDERIGLTADKVKLLKEQKAGFLQQVFNRELVFTDDNGDTYADWEQKKLGDLYRMASGMPFKGEEYQAGGEYSVITNANVQGNRYLDMSSASRISAPPERIKPHQILKKGDILISLDGNVGRISMVKEGKLLLAQRVGLLQPKSSQVLDNDFLYICLANDKFKDEMLSKQQGGGLKHIYARDVEGFEISVPSLNEQKKIGSFFAALDEQIELTEDKLTLLKEQKKGYLQGIFG